MLRLAADGTPLSHASIRSATEAGFSWKGATAGDLIVVIPGIMGSVLRAAGRDVWNTSVGTVARALPSLSRKLVDLALPEGLGDEAPKGPDQLAATDLIRGWYLWPGFWTGPGYGQLVQDFQRRSRRTGDVRFFAYDWRLSNRYNARLLGTFVERELARWRADLGEPAAEVTIVAHSMGGLIARYYLEVIGGRDYVRRLVTVGTPYSGSIKAVQLLTGHTPWYLGRWQEALTHAARTMPSLWQLLPTYRCVTTADGPIRLDETAIPGLDDGSVRPRLEDGLRFRAEIAAAAKANGAPDYTHHVVVGGSQPTPQSLTVADKTITYHRVHRSHDYLGDGTVPRFSAVPAEWKDDAHATVVACRHGALLNHKQLRDHVWNIAHALELGPILAPPVELGMDVPEVASARSPLPVRLRANRTNLRLVGRLRDPGTGTIIAERTLRADGSGHYECDLPVSPGIWEVEATAVTEQPPATVKDLVVVVDDAIGSGHER